MSSVEPEKKCVARKRKVFEGLGKKFLKDWGKVFEGLGKKFFIHNIHTYASFFQTPL